MNNGTLDSLGVSFLSTRALIAIDSFMEKGNLSDRAREALNDATKLIDFAKKGRDYSQHFKVGAEDVIEATSIYGDVMLAAGSLIKNEVLLKRSLDDLFKQFSETIQKIKDGKLNPNDNKEEIEEVRQLFKTIKDIALEKSLSSVNDKIVLEPHL